MIRGWMSYSTKRHGQNESTMISWLRPIYSQATVYSHLLEEPRLRVVDAFSAHLTRGVREDLKKLSCSGSYMPAGCTRYIQPLDVANQPLKRLVKGGLPAPF